MLYQLSYAGLCHQMHDNTGFRASGILLVIESGSEWGIHLFLVFVSCSFKCFARGPPGGVRVAASSPPAKQVYLAPFPLAPLLLAAVGAAVPLSPAGAQCWAVYRRDAEIVLIPMST